MRNHVRQAFQRGLVSLVRSRLARVGLLLLAVIVGPSALSVAQGSAVLLPKGLPKELWEAMIPPENRVTPEKVQLGRRLFYDRRLSVDGSVACATCHDPDKGFADGKKVSDGVGGKKGSRNAPTILNAVFNEFQFWDGRAASFEEQARGPMTNPLEMGMADHDLVVSRVGADPTYVASFEQIYGRRPRIDDVVGAIATFERTVVSGDSAFDRFRTGDRLAMSASAQRGWELWNGKARCSTCHPFSPFTPNFTDNKVHNIGVAAKGEDFDALARKAVTVTGLRELAFHPDYAELGRFTVTRQPRDLGAFKTPGLRDIALTAPYMHDGSEATLAGVIDFYDKGGEANLYLDPLIQPLKLTHSEKHELVAFMEALTGQGEGAANRPALRDPAKK